MDFKNIFDAILPKHIDHYSNLKTHLKTFPIKLSNFVRKISSTVTCNNLICEIKFSNCELCAVQILYKSYATQKSPLEQTNTHALHIFNRVDRIMLFLLIGFLDSSEKLP
jgi:hypothetical protein